MKFPKDKCFLYFLLASFVFLILKLFEMKFKFSDGFTYMYMGKMVLEGFVPYRDFFFASPPLQIYILAFAELFSGGNFLILKIIPIIATIGSGFFIYDYMKKKFGSRYGLVASVLFLFSFLTLLTTDYSTGISETMFFVLGMVYFAESGKPFIAGLFGSFALLIRLYAPLPIAGTLLYYFIYRKKEILKFILGVLTLFLPVSVIFELISHGAYLNQIFFFRLHLVSGIGLSKWSVVSFFLVGDIMLVLGSFLYFIFDKEKKSLFLPILATSFSVLLYIFYSDIYYLYFGLIIAFFAIFTTKFIFEFEGSSSFRKVLILAVMILVIVNSSIYVADYASASNMPFTSSLVSFIKSNSLPNDTIYGNFQVAPLISLLSGRSLAGNIADTNPKNIMTNTFTIKDVEDRISGVKFIIEKGNILSDGTLTGFDDSTPLNYMKSNCSLVKTYPVENDLNGNNFIGVWECS
jgi:hypothetical protein